MTILKFPSNQSGISKINYQVNFFRCSYKFDRRCVTKIIQQIIPALRYVIKKASEFISILNHLFRCMVRPGAQRCATHANRSTKQSWKSERYKTRNKNPKQKKRKNRRIANILKMYLWIVQITCENRWKCCQHFPQKLSLVLDRPQTRQYCFVPIEKPTVDPLNQHYPLRSDDLTPEILED